MKLLSKIILMTTIVLSAISASSQEIAAEKGQIYEGSKLTFRSEEFSGVLKTAGNNPDGKIDFYYEGVYVGTYYVMNKNQIKATEDSLRKTTSGNRVFIDFYRNKHAIERVVALEPSQAE